MLCNFPRSKWVHLVCVTGPRKGPQANSSISIITINNRIASEFVEETLIAVVLGAAASPSTATWT